MQLNRKQKAAFWCERTLNRTLGEVARTVKILLEKDDEPLVYSSLRAGYPTMPISTIIALAKEVTE